MVTALICSQVVPCSASTRGSLPLWLSQLLRHLSPEESSTKTTAVLEKNLIPSGKKRFPADMQGETT